MLLYSNVLGYVSGIFGLFNSFRLTLIFVDEQRNKISLYRLSSLLS